MEMPSVLVVFVIGFLINGGNCSGGICLFLLPCTRLLGLEHLLNEAVNVCLNVLIVASHFSLL